MLSPLPTVFRHLREKMKRTIGSPAKNGGTNCPSTDQNCNEKNHFLRHHPKVGTLFKYSIE
jgi:hypothetical protein